jgi:hypothetical protein
MAIIYDLNNALKPPILDNITNINSPAGQGLYLLADTDFILQGYGFNQILGGDISINANNILSLEGLNGIELNAVTKFLGLSTALILALTPQNGMQVFCTTINQMVFYQVSPITGLVLGWYNSTGSIKL